MGRNKKRMDEIAKAWANLNALLAEDAKTNTKPEPRLPLEPGGPGRNARFVTFVKHFNGSTPYRYAAVRPEGKTTWSVTGRTSMVHMSWDRLMAFVIQEEFDPIAAAASVRQLTGNRDPEDTGLAYADDEDEEDTIVDALNYQNTREAYIPLVQY